MDKIKTAQEEEKDGRTKKRNFNLPHQEEIDKEVRLILAFFKFLPKH
jgi:hypothetical protein